MDNGIVLATSDLSKNYMQGHELIRVLSGINFSIKKGEFAVLLGPSGSGKSTFLNLAGLLDSPSEGEIKLFGSSASGLDETKKSKIRMMKIGFVSQFDSLLPEFTLLENTDMPARICSKSDPAKALELLERFGLAEMAGKFPMEVSGGEKQRAAVARALRNDPELLLADEPTGNLDKHNAKIIFNDLKTLADSGIAVIMATHNEEAARYASRIVHLNDGKFTENEKR